MKKYALVWLAFILVTFSITFQASSTNASEIVEDNELEGKDEEDSSEKESDESSDISDIDEEKESDIDEENERENLEKLEEDNKQIDSESNKENNDSNDKSSSKNHDEKNKLDEDNSEEEESDMEPFSNTIKKYNIGDKGSHVKDLKKDLTKLGFGNFPKEPSQTYGKITANVVKEFQKYAHLSQTGIADSSTREAMEKVLNLPYQNGDRGVAIKEIKQNLSQLGFGNFPKNPSIHYGSVTSNVVKKFQAANGLKQSGQVNQDTLNKIDDVLHSEYAIGQKGKHVREMKQDLTALGFGNFPKNPSITYGKVTANVVKDFQQYANLPQTGIADTVTLDRIASVLNPPYQNGDRGVAIKNMKRDLTKLGFGNFPKNPSIHYGNATAKVVTEFQKLHQIKQTGEANQETLNKINELLHSNYAIGQKGEHVRELKQDLTMLSFGNFPKTPSTTYGKVTANVVKDFQKYAKLPQTGIADQVTLDTIKKIKNPPYKDGDRGVAIIQLKKRLSSLGYGNFPKTPSPHFGKVTSNVVKDFQRDAGLDVDGSAGEATLGALENPYVKGAEGQYIVQLKKDLTKLGYGNFPKNPSKKYGNVTAKVIEELQQDHKLTINGVADDATLDKIRQLIKQGYKKPSKSITKTEYTNYRLSLNKALDIQMKRPIITTDLYSQDPAYVSANYLRLTGSAKVVGNNVNIRTAPDTSKNNVAFKLVGGSPITITGAKQGTKLSGSTLWYEISQKGKKYYIHSQHASGAKAEVISTVNVRAGKGASHHKFGQLNKGDKVKLISQGPSWHQIEFGGWRIPKRADLKAFLDPSKNDKFQHLRLDSKVGVTAKELNKPLKNKGVLEGQGEAFINGAKKHGVNEAYLMSHAFLETGHGTSALAKGIEVGKDKKGNLVRVTSSNRKNLSAIKKTYNMFGIGAVDSNPVNAGAIKAYEEGWFTPKKAIEGGAKWIGEGYIYNEYEQNTLYKMRWNPDMVNGASWKQYASDIAWATKQVSQIKNIYSQLSNPNYHYDIAKYN